MARSLKIARNVLALATLVLAASLIGSSVSGAQVHLELGNRTVVFGVDPLGLSVREGPGFQFPVLATVPLETEVRVVEGPSWAGNVPWYLIAGYDAVGSQGWAAGSYLQPSEVESAEAKDEAAPERSASSRGGRRDGQSFIALVTGYAIQGRTATGQPTEWGIVAVDPSVVPLGSKIQIDGFEETFVAADTGGAVKGNWVDIWFPSYGEAKRFGIQSRRVTIVEP